MAATRSLLAASRIFQALKLAARGEGSTSCAQTRLSTLQVPRLLTTEGTSTPQQYCARAATTSASSSGIRHQLRYQSTATSKAASKATSTASPTEPAPRKPGGPISWQSFGLTMLTGAGLVGVYQYLMEKKKQASAKKQTMSVGAPDVGGDWTLMGDKGKTVKNSDLHGQWVLLYFGFTHCPDICPDELVKISEAVDLIEKQSKLQVLPVFISIDPERDTVAQVQRYVKEFHPRMLGLTGKKEALDAAARAYRVYHSKANVTSKDDYLIDHSIITYLLTPEGNFVKHYGKNVNVTEMAASIQEIVAEWAPSST